MPRITARTEADPVSQAIAHSSLMAAGQPVPLVSTSYDINIRGGLADVEASRTFRNVETDSIEATITFPLPVNAVLYGFEASIGDRVLKAKARAKSHARADYEDAIDRGKTAVLHEELIKGIHLLSLGHIAPGTDIEVRVRFALPLSHVDGRNVLRIPTTVGDVYGCSGFQDCDDLVHGGPMQTAALTVSCADGEAVLSGGQLTDGRASIALDRPIDIEVRNWKGSDIVGQAADGKSITLSINPVDAGEGAIHAAILFDRSGSMGERCALSATLTKHAAAMRGLAAANADLRTDDRLHIFQFDSICEEIGEATAATWRGLLEEAGGPRGGTEIGGAIQFAIARSRAQDVLLITDGKSHALDVQKLANSERRFTVVLIGEDSLEANVGHLAVLSGGDIFIPAGAAVTGAVKSALATVRRLPASRDNVYVRGGMTIEVEGGAAGGDPLVDGFGRAVAAYAASLKLSSLDEKAAAQLAEAEGLVTHLTSLILVDEEGVAQQGIPAMRKVALPAPATSPVRMYLSAAPLCESYAEAEDLGELHPTRIIASHSFSSPRSYSGAGAGNTIRQSFSHGRSKTVTCEKKGRRLGSGSGGSSFSQPASRHESEPAEDVQVRPAPTGDLSSIVELIDWPGCGNQLATGDLSCLDSRLGSLILKASEGAAVRKAAKRAKISQVLMVIGVLAWVVREQDRHAARVARSILGNLSGRLIAQVAHRLRLVADKKAA